MEKRLVVLSGAGMSAESGIQTFRDAGGLWEGHDVMEVASLEGWRKNKELVLDFYNQRRRQLLTCEPNEAHLLLAELEKQYNTTIVTQNVDDLHERAGSSHIIHLHGELLKVRSVQNSKLIYPWAKDLHSTDTNDLGHKLRPHIVWFGEMVPELENAIPYVKKADVIIIIGTSMQVYPAASLIHYAKPNTLVYYIDTNPAIINQTPCKINIIAKKASIGLKSIINDLKNNSQ
ncbi:NAD-dependent deacylase [Myroides marinus]|uniref:SIR2 family NAD-dependent protein deacylase n=1 Tax=Myroides marinus TaxID=703342 RepID=UPI002578B4B5|nr:NAD-dependent deacylase [Myroides marinus]MDM1348388.1 NAD-dependent deacylase [Myroides marinus]MDM1351930.1 NAD-dependent deacylase [Myroides marinus]MDM1359107.1 NAD-dependent deacylase [Myroides marinus]MDM1366241.1 NAD-dependent deacylase [Myroides marinus]